MTEEQAIHLCDEISDRLGEHFSGAIHEIAEKVPDDLIEPAMFSILMHMHQSMEAVWSSMGLTHRDEGGEDTGVPVTFLDALLAYREDNPEDFDFTELKEEIDQRTVRH